MVDFLLGIVVGAAVVFLYQFLKSLLDQAFDMEDDNEKKTPV